MICKIAVSKFVICYICAGMIPSMPKRHMRGSFGESKTIDLTLLTRQRNLPDLFSLSVFLFHAQLERVSGYKKGLFAFYNAQHATRNTYYRGHRGHGAHKDNQLIKQAILCVLCDLCGENGFLRTHHFLATNFI